ncbi:MAG: hypothetical protein FWG77_03930 [Treponema sp.]|nr:hypothetical protein [Treponema sp.]
MKDLEEYENAKDRIKEYQEKGLEELDLSSMEEIPKEILKLKSLKSLNLTNTKKNIPSFIGKIISLEKLTLGDSSSSLVIDPSERIILPPELGNLQNLRELTFKYSIPVIPEWVWNLEKLEILNIQNNDIETIPTGIGKLKNLRKIEINGEEISSLPHEIGKQLHLTHLSLNCPKLKILPESLSNLKSLEEFEFINCNMTAIPDIVCNWTLLKSLRIEMAFTFVGPYTSLKSIPQNIGDLKNLTTLILSRTSITKIPESLCYCPIEHLEFYGDFITLPESFGDLSGLIKLELYSSKLKNLPESFGKLKKLEYLSLRTWHDLKLPESFGKLTALREFYIRANNMKTFPKSINGLKNLKTLSLESDKLQSLPESICNLAKLEYLGLKTYNLKKLPRNFGNLAKLKHLHVFSGVLTELPKTICNLRKLKKLYIDGYNIKKIPAWLNKLPCKKNMLYIDSKNKKLSLPESTGRENLEPAFNQYINMSFSYMINLHDSYSLKKIESILCSAPKYQNAKEDEKKAFENIMFTRRRKLISKFKWTEENKKQLVKVSNDFLKAWETGYTKAKTIIETLYESEENKDAFEEKYYIEVILHPDILIKEGANVIGQERIYEVILDYLNPDFTLNMTVTYDPATKDESEYHRDPYVDRSINWNAGGFGDIELKDEYICLALNRLYAENHWAFQDIMKINYIATEIKIDYENEVIK